MTKENFGYTAASHTSYINMLCTHLGRAFGGDSQVSTETIIKGLVGHNNNGVTVVHPTDGRTVVCPDWDFHKLMLALVEVIETRWFGGFVGHTLTDEALTIHWNWGTPSDEVIDLVPLRFETRDLSYLTK